MNTVHEPKADAYVTAWHRSGRGSLWHRLFDAEGMDAAWARLLARNLGGDVCVLPVDRDPNTPRRFAAGGRRMQ